MYILNYVLVGVVVKQSSTQLAGVESVVGILKSVMVNPTKE